MAYKNVWNQDRRSRRQWIFICLLVLGHLLMGCSPALDLGLSETLVAEEKVADLNGAPGVIQPTQPPQLDPSETESPEPAEPITLDEQTKELLDQAAIYHENGEFDQALELDPELEDAYFEAQKDQTQPESSANFAIEWVGIPARPI
ncbi:MAG: hypothetical protein AAF633_01885 [Chloroflexota bacterium]